MSTIYFSESDHIGQCMIQWQSEQQESQERRVSINKEGNGLKVDFAAGKWGMPVSKTKESFTGSDYSEIISKCQKVGFSKWVYHFYFLNKILLIISTSQISLWLISLSWWWGEVNLTILCAILTPVFSPSSAETIINKTGKPYYV